MLNYHIFSISLGALGIILLVIANKLPLLMQQIRVIKQKAISKKKELERLEKLEKTRAMKAAGDKGEKSVQFLLDHLDTNIYKVWNGIYLHHHGTEHEFDHLVVGPSGLIHIETKVYSGELTFTPNGIEQVKTDRYGNRHDKKILKDPTGQIILHELLLKKILNANQLMDVNITNILCIAHETAQIIGSPVNPSIFVCKEPALLHIINEQSSSIDLETQNNLIDAIDSAIVERRKVAENA
ncbi:NERD domain-containing protein [Paenibacillus alginolyticus]|uniref:NERD domain-containing protein n=1 Tax=Paenibacillus alginolyticus TaxID=59839 RepID=A0ABT4G8K0_9BACL|nr:nuclease-related domain-containing protein [Paenibacillus alginolyticus]MCY9667213.1 NERD domain-containing protein [Paenibacillus alginolyticus]MCY9692495.1 NERD domain-containing protein [Paenibacillus alginolyticus]MEC0144288.1 nuclease-related domain-containing protein [Paenibacillus alginolyticus]